MSADNGVYVGSFPDGFRVIHAQAIENLIYYKEGTSRWKKEIDAYFGGHKVYSTEPDAFEAARRVAHGIMENGVLEYGVAYIGHFDHIPLGPTPANWIEEPEKDIPRETQGQNFEGGIRYIWSELKWALAKIEELQRELAIARDTFDPQHDYDAVYPGERVRSAPETLPVGRGKDYGSNPLEAGATSHSERRAAFTICSKELQQNSVVLRTGAELDALAEKIKRA